MAEPWNKLADWIPYTNALAQVAFWKDDLRKIERSLAILEMMGVPEDDNGYKLTKREINTSKRGLALAQFKLKRSFARLTDSDLITWADKAQFNF